ncbi:hypothetical protein FKM82_022355 [Ascaphus truei]
MTILWGSRMYLYGGQNIFFLFVVLFIYCIRICSLSLSRYNSSNWCFPCYIYFSLFLYRINVLYLQFCELAKCIFRQSDK